MHIVQLITGQCIDPDLMQDSGMKGIKYNNHNAAF